MSRLQTAVLEALSVEESDYQPWVELTEEEVKLFTISLDGSLDQMRGLLRDRKMLKTTLEAKQRPLGVTKRTISNLQIMVDIAIRVEQILITKLLLATAKEHNIPPTTLLGQRTVAAAAAKGSLEMFKTLVEVMPECTNADVVLYGHPLTHVIGRNERGTLSADQETSFVKFLLEHGADPNAYCGSPQSAHLIGACMHSPIGVIKLLIKHGADRNRGAIQAAVMANRVEVLDALHERGVGINQPLLQPIESSRDKKMMMRIESETPLHLAVRYKSKEAATWLLKHRAEMDILDDFGMKASDYASQSGDREMVEIFAAYERV
jgi:ankyrin repeat protein